MRRYEGEPVSVVLGEAIVGLLLDLSRRVGKCYVFLSRVTFHGEYHLWRALAALRGAWRVLLLVRAFALRWGSRGAAAGRAEASMRAAHLQEGVFLQRHLEVRCRATRDSPCRAPCAFSQQPAWLRPSAPQLACSHRWQGLLPAGCC